MNGGEFMTVVIVAIVMIAGIVRAHVRNAHSNNDPRIAPAAPQGEADRLRDEVRSLKDRIAVLERVITDNHASSDLDREIEKLRDRS